MTSGTAGLKGCDGAWWSLGRVEPVELELMLDTNLKNKAPLCSMEEGFFFGYNNIYCRTFVQYLENIDRKENVNQL